MHIQNFAGQTMSDHKTSFNQLTKVFKKLKKNSWQSSHHYIDQEDGKTAREKARSVSVERGWRFGKQHHSGHNTRGGDSEGWQAPEFRPQTPKSHAMDNHVPFSILSRWRALSRARISNAERMKDQEGRPISGVSCKPPRPGIIDLTRTPNKAASTPAGYRVKTRILIESAVAWDSAFPKAPSDGRDACPDHALRHVGTSN